MTQYFIASCPDVFSLYEGKFKSTFMNDETLQVLPPDNLESVSILVTNIDKNTVMNVRMNFLIIEY